MSPGDLRRRRWRKAGACQRPTCAQSGQSASHALSPSTSTRWTRGTPPQQPGPAIRVTRPRRAEALECSLFPWGTWLSGKGVWAGAADTSPAPKPEAHTGHVTATRPHR